MPSEFESAFREMLSAVIREVVVETNAARRDDRSIHSENGKHALLLNSREAARALSISEPHLSRLTRSGVIPHLRVGKCLRYSAEALGNWIRQSQSTEPTVPRTITTKNLENPKPAKKPTPVSEPSNKPQSKTLPKPAEAKEQKKKAITAASPKTRQSKQNTKQIIEDQSQRNPFAELLAEIGIDRSSLPSITNGELMRISETEIGTYHGWMYLNRPLPEEAREKLKKHFLRVVSSNGKG
jgi:excisionase family DNA binding protein